MLHIDKSIKPKIKRGKTIPGGEMRVNSHLRFITRFRLPLGSRMDCASLTNRNRVINLRCE